MQPVFYVIHNCNKGEGETVREYVINRPDNEKIQGALQAHASDAAGAILRLAWQAGLLRDEIQRLTWAQVDFVDRQLLLSDRAVPLCDELCAWLLALQQQRNGYSEVVVLSDRDQKPLTPQSISRLARQALDEVEQQSVRLIDLRHDFVIRQLEQKDWQYVSRITGIEAAAMNLHFAAYLTEKKLSTRVQRSQPVQVDEFALWKLLQAEKTTPAGLTLWLTWQLGLQLEEIVALRWNQVDLEKEMLQFADGTVEMTSGITNILKTLAAGQPDPQDFVITAPRSGQPYDRTRLSKMVRSALIRGGLDDVTLRDLRMDGSIRVGGENQVVAYLRKSGSISRNEAAELLQVSRTTAYYRLKQMVRRGKLAQVGTRYYLKDAVVPPEQQKQVILEYLSREGFAYRQDIARLLRIDSAQCRPILQKMVAEGDLSQERQRYRLKEG